eukprot:10098667-Alexandrium_andersonii.AAC.1
MVGVRGVAMLRATRACTRLHAEATRAEQHRPGQTALQEYAPRARNLACQVSSCAPSPVALAE